MSRVSRSLSRPFRVAVVGGGLAGLAAATRLIDAGASVDLFESRPRLGGRAGSFAAAEGEPPIDYGQHVSMGCCTALDQWLRRAGLADAFETHRQLNFLGPDGRCRRFHAVGWLPSPLHLLPSLWRLDFFEPVERRRLIGALWAMKRLRFDALDASAGDETVESWLYRQRQTPRAIEGFWSPVLVSALGETVDRASLRAARKVIVDGLLASRHAYELKIPRLPLAEIFDARLGDWLESRGVRIHRRTRVSRIEGNSHRVRAVVFSRQSNKLGATGVSPVSHWRNASGTQVQTTVEFDAVVAAVPWNRVGRLFSAELRAALPGLDRAEQIAPAAITTVHLAYDRPITDLPHAVLVGRLLGQWMFAKPDNQYQVVISASHRSAIRILRDHLGEQVERELAEAFPAARGAKVLRRRVVVQPRAVFSYRPGVDALRLPQATPIANLALAGDWTATGWPATMEGAVRGGQAAAEAIVNNLDT